MSSSLFPTHASLLTIPAGADSFTVPTPPASSSSAKILLAPDFTAGPTGLDPYRSWSVSVLDGLCYLANGFDQPKRWDGASTFYNVGSTAPTTFSVALTVGAATFADGTTHDYYLVFYNSVTGKETAPQLTSGVPGTSLTNSSGGARDFLITWTDPGGEFDKARIYRRLQNSDNYHLVATVMASTATYTDTTTDATLINNTAYVTTYRTTLPPVFDWLRAYQGRLFGGFRESATVHYAQAVRIDSALRAEDFPDAWILQPGEEDGTGGVITMLPHYASAYFFKRRACFELAGSDPATWAIRKISNDRGCIAERCIVQLEENALVLDERGLYWWTTSGESVVAGATTGTKESPLQPTWDRMNLGAADTFFALHDPSSRIAMFFIALDFEPVPNVAVVFDYGENRFVSIDTLVWSSAGGRLQDALGNLHLVRACDMGYVWEVGYGASAGVFAGDNTATLTAAARTAIADSGAAFDTTDADGGPGTPYERYDTDGTLLDQNRVRTNTSTTVTPFYFSVDAPSVGQSIALGVIPAVVRTPRTSLRTVEKKWVRGIILEHDNGVSGDIRVDTATNENSLTLQKQVDLTTNLRTIVPVSDRCWTWTMQFSQRYANLGFSIRAVHIDYIAVPGQRQ